MIEVFNDWRGLKPAAPERGKKGPVPRLIDPKEIGERLATLQQEVLNVHCYKDVGYPWVQVVFADLIDPRVALEVGAELAALAGEEFVYFNSLRPRAVYFLLEPAFDPAPDLKIERYGEKLASLRNAWGLADSAAISRSAASPRKAAARPVAAR